MPHRELRTFGGPFTLVLALVMAVAANADVLDTAIQTEQQTNEQSQDSQQRINRLSEETEDLLAEYRRVVRETEALQVYNDQLSRVVDNQRVEIDSINKQLAELEETNRGVVPLLLEMIDMLEQIVEADTPFLLDTRRNLIFDLQDMVYRADVTTSEKYRRVMEAYQREIDFGRNVSAYEGKLPGTDRTVSFVKVGRVLLIYQTLDQEQVGWWNPVTRNWEELPAEYESSIARAVRIAKNQEAPNLVKLPVVGPRSAQ
ncbi:MAG: DUF3450 domain-containing protein [Xanthomonadales bacterium]|nr:DUF3450 domain-containing protein [Xanthomonadales bacterium]